MLPNTEIDSAIRYYNEYFDDAGAEHEADAILELGDINMVAREIIEEYKKNNPYFSAPDPAPAKSWSAPIIGKNGKLPLWLFIVLLVFASPFIIAAVSVIFSLLISIASVLFAVAVSVIAIFAASIGVMVSGIAAMFTSPAAGMMLLGIGLILMAVSVVLFVPTMMFFTRALPFLCKESVRLTKRMFTWRGGAVYEKSV